MAMTAVRHVTRWGLLWHSHNRLDGETRHIIFDRDTRQPAMFRTRAQARAYAKERYSYIKDRPDLQQEPHGWRMPAPVRLSISVAGEAA